MATTTILVKSNVSKRMMENGFAPNTFRMEISLILRCAVKAAKPKSPNQEMRIANPAKYFDKVETRFSDSYNS